MLTERQKHILSIVVSEYVNSAAPVSSQVIARVSELGVSPATIRNELGALEDMGYIMHPHTSAGRVPTDKGYRYFVDHLLERESVSREMAGKVADVFKERVKSLDELMRKVSKLLSSMTEEASLVVFPKLEIQHFKKVSVIPVDATRIVVVWISTSGLVWHGSVDLDSPTDLETLGRLANFLNSELEGLPFQSMEGMINSKLRERRDSLARFYELAMKVIRESLKVSQELRLFLDGSTNVLGKPDFDDLGKNRKLLSLFDSKQDLLRLFDRDEQSSAAGIKVRIGDEGQWKDISDCSLITSTYQMKDDSTGLLGVLGPKRMNYPKIISLVEYMAREMADVLQRRF